MFVSAPPTDSSAQVLSPASPTALCGPLVPTTNTTEVTTYV
jgi:hypothetical protein